MKKTAKAVILVSVLVLGSMSSAAVRPDTEIDYRYSTLVVSTSNAQTLFLRVNNTDPDNQRTLTTSLSGVNGQATFSDGTASKTYTLSPFQERRFQLKVSPNSPGDYTLTATTIDQDLGLENSDSIPVHVRELPSSTVSRDVPGIGVVNLIVIVLLSTVLYSSSL